MENTVMELRELLQQKAELQARISQIPYDGYPEIKENASGRYLYVRKRENGKNRSVYVNVYSPELYDALVRYSQQLRQLRKELRSVEKNLAQMGYEESELSPRVQLNLDFARANMKSCIYDQAILEGISTTFPQTETILENGEINGMNADDVQKILNLKRSWEFVLDKDVLLSKTDYYMLTVIAKLVNEGFFMDGGKIRSVPVYIGGSAYRPPIPYETDVRQAVDRIVSKKDEPIDVAIDLCLYCMKTQIFIDGNKRASVIFANQYLISHGGGLLIISEGDVPQFKSLLVNYYEDKDSGQLKQFMKQQCWKQF